MHVPTLPACAMSQAKIVRLAESVAEQSLRRISGCVVPLPTIIRSTGGEIRTRESQNEPLLTLDVRHEWKAYDLLEESYENRRWALATALAHRMIHWPIVRPTLTCATAFTVHNRNERAAIEAFWFTQSLLMPSRRFIAKFSEGCMADAHARSRHCAQAFRVPIDMAATRAVHLNMVDECDFKGMIPISPARNAPVRLFETQGPT